jgi:hypothetical protein
MFRPANSATEESKLPHGNSGFPSRQPENQPGIQSSAFGSKPN